MRFTKWYDGVPTPLRPLAKSVHRFGRILTRNANLQVARLSQWGIGADAALCIMRRQEPCHAAVFEAPNGRRPLLRTAAFHATLNAIGRQPLAWDQVRLLLNQATQKSPNDPFHICAVRQAVGWALGGYVPRHTHDVRRARFAVRHALLNLHPDRFARLDKPLCADALAGYEALRGLLNALDEVLRHPAYAALLQSPKLDHYGAFCPLTVGIPLLLVIGALTLACLWLPAVAKFVIRFVLSCFTVEVARVLYERWFERALPRSGLRAWLSTRRFRQPPMEAAWGSSVGDFSAALGAAAVG